MRVAIFLPRRSLAELISFVLTMPKISVSEDMGEIPTAAPLFHMDAEGRSPAEMKSPRPARNASVAVAPVVKTVSSTSSPSWAKKPRALATCSCTQCSSVPLKILTLSCARLDAPARSSAIPAIAECQPNDLDMYCPFFRR